MIRDKSRKFWVITARRTDRRNSHLCGPPYPDENGWVWSDRRQEPDRRLHAAPAEGLGRGVESALFHALVEDAPEAMLLLNGRGILLVVNRQGEALFGYRREELLGEPAELLFREGLRSFFAPWRDAALPDLVRLDLQGHRRDTAFPAQLSLAPVRSAVQPLVLALVRDLSEQQQAFAALRQKAFNLATSNIRLQAEIEALQKESAELKRVNAELQRLGPF